jgi:hypothetical protein
VKLVAKKYNCSITDFNPISQSRGKTITHLKKRIDGGDIPLKPIKGGKNMTSTDDIRRYVIENLIEPARNRGTKEITIRAGDIHSALGLKDRMPMVCSALETKLDYMADVKVINIEAPPSGRGANYYITYQL